MKRMIAIVLALLIIFTGCNTVRESENQSKETTNEKDTKEGTKDTVKDEPKQTDEVKMTDETVVEPAQERVQAISLDNGLFLILSDSPSLVKYTLAMVTTTEKYELGKTIEFTLDGGVKESFPVQITAKDVKDIEWDKQIKIDHDLAKQILELKGDKAVYLDVRTNEEYASGHIPDALLIPLDKLEWDIAHVHDKDQLFLVYCRSGNRSQVAIDILKEQGYTAFDLGGINEYPGKLKMESE